MGFARQESALMGTHKSARVFGHAGEPITLAFADPEFGLTVAYTANGRPTERMTARKRMTEMSSAIYEDLGIGMT
jgi:hypothetical protein